MSDYPFFRVGGEMGKLIRAFDWKNSPLGSPGAWPTSLRTSVSTVLGSKFPMLLMWGDDLVQIYNDGYREILGDMGKHPKAMGQNAADCWAEVWSMIAPSIEDLKRGKEGTWNEDSPDQIQRNGQLEQIFTTSSLGPIVGESGSVEGVLLVCMDTTSRIQASEESRRNLQRFEAAVEAVQGIVWTNNSLGEMEGKQPGWEALTGQTQEDYQKFGWTRAVHPEDVQRSVDAWNLAVKTRSTYEIEHRILRHTGEWGIFTARAIPLFNQDGSIREWVGVHTDITAQRKMENSIIQNEQKLRSFLESTPFPTAVYAGSNLTIEIANQAIIDVWGKGTDVIGKTFTDLLPELATQQVFDQIKTVYATGIAFHKRNTAIDVFKNGKMQTGYFNYSFTPVTTPDGKVYGVMNTAADVTDLNVARHNLAASEKRLSNLVMQANVATALFAGKEMTLIMANDAMKQLWEIDETSNRQTLLELQPDLKQQLFAGINNDVFLSGEKYSLEAVPVKLHKKGGVETVYIDFNYQALYDEGSSVTDILVMGVDVTHRVLAQNLISRSAENLRNTILKAPVAMCILKGRDHIVEIVNDRMLELWGRSIEQVRGKGLFEALPEASNEGFKALADGVFFSGQSYSALAVPVTLPRDKKLQTVFVNFLCEAFREPNEIISGIIIVAVDVTPQILAHKQIEEVVATRTEELAEANQKLVQSNDELSQYAYIASHDLQEPLRKIRTFTSMLFRGVDIDEESRALIDKIAGSAERMSSLIQDLLDFSSLVDGRVAPEEVDLQIVVSRIIEDHELSVLEKKASISIGELPKVLASALQMNQLFYNLLGNALKFTSPDRFPVIYISSRFVDAAEAGQHVAKPEPGSEYYEISISDNGIGFAPEYGMQIFEPFKRLHTRNAFPGSGIGLALCQRIVKIHGGALYAKSALGEGSTFSVLLPNLRSGGDNVT